jgi:hypothetical protein
MLLCFIQIRYAYELLTNPILKRDYDLFGLDEHTVNSLYIYVYLDMQMKFSSFSFPSVCLPVLPSNIRFHLLGCSRESQRTV